MIYQRPYLLIVTWGVRIKTQVWRNANPSPLLWLAPQSGEGQCSSRTWFASGFLTWWLHIFGYVTWLFLSSWVKRQEGCYLLYPDPMLNNYCYLPKQSQVALPLHLTPRTRTFQEGYYLKYFSGKIWIFLSPDSIVVCISHWNSLNYLNSANLKMVVLYFKVLLWCLANLGLLGRTDCPAFCLKIQLTH